MILLFCVLCIGTATIYGSPVAEIAEGAEMKQLVGICPQFNIIFDVLTVEEHLRIFAAIKGILPSDIDGEVGTPSESSNHIYWPHVDSLCGKFKNSFPYNTSKKLIWHQPHSACLITSIIQCNSDLTLKWSWF